MLKAMWRRTLAVMILCAAVTAWGDVTARMQVQVTVAPALTALLPPSAAPFKRLLEPFDLTEEQTPGKSAGVMGPLSFYIDPGQGKLVLLDTVHHHFLAMPYPPPAAPSTPAALPNLPPAAAEQIKALQIDVQSHVTAQTETIAGMAAEQTEIDVAVTTMAGMPPTMRAVVDLWHPTNGAETPALREWMRDSAAQRQAQSASSAALQQLMQSGPLAPLADKFKALQNAFSSDRPVVKLHVDLYAPMVMQMIAMSAAGGGQMTGSLDPGGPLLSVDTVLTSVSSAPLAAETFQIPPGYTAESQDEFFKDILPFSVPASIRGQLP